MYDITRYYHEVEEGMGLPGPLRGAAFAAASKRIKMQVVLFWLRWLVEHEQVDMTPTLACHIAEYWLGRGVDKKKLMVAFATPGRTAADKSRDHVRAEQLAEGCELQVLEALEQAQLDMLAVREAVKSNMKQPDQP